MSADTPVTSKQKSSDSEIAVALRNLLDHQGSLRDPGWRAWVELAIERLSDETKVIGLSASLASRIDDELSDGAHGDWLAGAQGLVDACAERRAHETPAPPDELKRLRKQMGEVAVLILQNDRDEVLRWARGVKLTFKDGDPELAAEKASCTCGFPHLPSGTAHRRDCALYDGASLEPPEQLFRLRPLCICDNALTNQNPACPVHGSAVNGFGDQT